MKTPKSPRTAVARLGLLVTIVAMPLAFSVEAQADHISRVVGVQQGDTLNVRTGPGGSFPDIGDISPNATVRVISYNASRRWAKIRWRGKFAYISAKYLRTIKHGSSSQTGSWVPRGRYRVSGLAAGDAGLNLRRRGTTNSAVLAKLPTGTLLRVTRRGAKSGWVYVVTQSGQRGFVYDKFLRPARSGNGAGSSNSGNASNNGSNNASNSGSNNGSNGGSNTSSGSGGPAPNCPIPGVFTVVNINAGNRLQVRDAASPVGNIIGSFGSSDAVAVVAWDHSGWVRVSTNEATGFVDGAFLQCGGHTTNQAGFPTNLTCYGTEPFWSAEINNNGTMTYKGVDQPNSPPATFQSTNPNNLTNGYPYTFAAVPFSGTVTRLICNDGMSDVTNIWGIQLNAPNGSGGFDTLNGCCRMK